MKSKSLLAITALIGGIAGLGYVPQFKDTSHYPTLEQIKARRLAKKNERRALNGLPPKENYRNI